MARLINVTPTKNERTSYMEFDQRRLFFTLFTERTTIDSFSTDLDDMSAPLSLPAGPPDRVRLWTCGKKVASTTGLPCTSKPRTKASTSAPRLLQVSFLSLLLHLPPVTFVHSAEAQDSFSYCPAIQKNSGQACDRCLNDDFCRVGLSCHLTHKLCYDATGPFLCNVNATVADMAVSANCEGICNVRFPPFFCGDACLNEDFPCKWVPNCAPNAMTHISCLRGCEDHDCCIPSRLQCSNCAQCYTMYQCNNADRNGGFSI